MRLLTTAVVCLILHFMIVEKFSPTYNLSRLYSVLPFARELDPCYKSMFSFFSGRAYICDLMSNSHDIFCCIFI